MQSLTHHSVKLSHHLGSPAYPFLRSTFNGAQVNHTNYLGLLVLNRIVFTVVSENLYSGNDHINIV